MDESNREFDAFYAAYPRKVARVAALRSWRNKKVSEDTFKTIMKALDAHKESAQWRKNGGQFIPHPATWINQERWNDELKVEVPKNNELQKKYGSI